MAGDPAREIRALRNLHELLTGMHSVQDLDEVLQTIAQGVVDVLGFQVAVINAVDSRGWVDVVAIAGCGEALEDARRALASRRMPLSEFEDEFAIADEWGLLRFVPHDRLPEDFSYSYVPDFTPVDAPDAWHPLDALYALMHGPDGELLGILSVDLPVGGRRPDESSRQILEMYAVQAGLALYHAQERDRLHERVRLGSATRRIIETASRELDLNRIVEESIEPLRSGFRCSRLLVRIFDTAEEGIGGEGLGGPGATYPSNLMERLRPRLAEQHLSAADAGAPDYLAMGERIACECWAKGRTAVMGEYGDTSAGLLSPEEREKAVALVEATDSQLMVMVPVGAGPDCMGYLTFLRTEPTQLWTDAEDEAALEVGREIGRAVVRARMYQRERKLVAELQQLDDYRAEMIGTITHELKNPLTSIRGHVELLEEAGVAPLSVGALSRSVTRLRALVDDMLLLTRIKDPKRPFLPTSCDLSTAVREAWEVLAIQADRGGITTDLSEVESGVMVWGERDELVHVVNNIVGNALKFTPDGGSVRVGLREDGDEVVFTCSDTGLGISEEDRSAMFEEFHRSSNPAARAVPGTGLGLAIVRRVVERHGGSVEVESALGSGSTFVVRLRARPEDELAETG